MHSKRTHKLIAPLLLSLAACNAEPHMTGGTTPTPGPSNPGGTTSTTMPSDGNAMPGTTTNAPTMPTMPTTPNQPTTPAAMPTPPVRASTVAMDLVAAGFDLKALPSLDDVVEESKMTGDHTKLRAVMHSFNTALGTTCTGCHTALTAAGKPDFAAETAQKNVAKHMWDKFVRGMTFKDGSPLYCDSCHRFQKQFLNRSDKDQLVAYMADNFVDKLSLVQPTPAKVADMNCATCHGAPFRPQFLGDWNTP